MCYHRDATCSTPYRAIQCEFPDSGLSHHACAYPSSGITTDVQILTNRIEKPEWDERVLEKL